MTSFVGLDVDLIEAGLCTELIADKVLVYNSTSSTSDVAWEYSQNSTNSGLCVFAEEQGSGRGRRGNKWVGGSGRSILCSILLKGFACEGELLTLAVAVGCAEVIGRYMGGRAKIKWPNDIIVGGSKIAGILLESRPGDSGVDYVVGVGINCHQGEDYFEGLDLPMPATSMDIESGRTIDRNEMAAELLNGLDRWIATAQNDGSRVIERWKQLSSLLGHHVSVMFDQKKFAGHCVGVDPVKGLILQLDRGGVRIFDASHTTIVKQVLSL